MKIIVAGAGIGGLYAAYLLGKNGHEVTVYESTDSLENMRYDWHDDANPKVFSDLGLEIPKESFRKGDWTFVSPCGNTLEMVQKEENVDYSIERRPLNAYLVGLAEQSAKVVFGTKVLSAVVEEGRVSGAKISLNGEETVVKCDLLVDSAGVDSVIRRNLPDVFGIEKEVDRNDVFIAYRAFYNAVPGKEAKYSNKVYMKHLGEDGISWCIRDNNPEQINVLVGRIGKLEKGVLDNAIRELKKDNPILGDDIKRGGITCVIPVRRPLNLFVADGYCLIGDSACMTVPIIGSGIATSLKAAKHLAEAIGTGEKSDMATLWKYQYGCYKDFGAQHCGVDHMKNWLLKCDNGDIDWVFGSGVLTNDDLADSSVGKMMKLSFGQMIDKLKVGYKRLPFLMKLSNMMNRSQKIAKVAEKIPEQYDLGAVEKWIAELEKNCKID